MNTKNIRNEFWNVMESNATHSPSIVHVKDTIHNFVGNPQDIRTLFIWILTERYFSSCSKSSRTSNSFPLSCKNGYVQKMLLWQTLYVLRPNRIFSVKSVDDNLIQANTWKNGCCQILWVNDLNNSSCQQNFKYEQNRISGYNLIEQI